MTLTHSSSFLTAGWQSATCDKDINECEVLANPCGDTGTCVNYDGTYTCNCFEGFKKVGDTCAGECDIQLLRLFNKSCNDNENRSRSIKSSTQDYV